MPTSKLTRSLFWAAECMLLSGTIVAATQIARPQEWRPLPLVALLLGLTVLGDWLSIEIPPSGQLSASMVATVLAMALLGPVPACAFSIAGTALISAVRRLTPPRWLAALSTFALVPFAGGLMIRGLAGHFRDQPGHPLAQSAVFGLIVLAVFILTVALNFVLFDLHKRVDEGRSLHRQIRELLLPLLPGMLAAGMLATILAVAYASVGLPMLVASIAVLLIFR